MSALAPTLDTLRSVPYPSFMEDTKACNQCGQVQPLETGFYRSKRNKDGRDSYCKACRDGRSTGWAKAKRAARPPKPVLTEKTCKDCGEVKPLSEFYPAGGGKVAHVCKPCKNARHKAYVSRPEVAAKLREQDRNRRSGSWKRPPRREPKEPGFEVCTMCNEDKPFAEFHAHKLGRNGRDSVCRECKRVAAAERYKDPDYQEQMHRTRVKNRFGLRPGQYDEMLAAQNHGCAICGAKAADGTTRRLHVDHCHASGQIRGLLCYSCNTGLGVFKDDPDLLRAAITYLLKGE